eukprot:GHRR01016241.1.p1 GENE.GHRR01016241.1~~GHRR01016241.1.p1  ORF type:complete len:184 (+),score=38.41 GHRR01016241.1:206-757(+)
MHSFVGHQYSAPLWQPQSWQQCSYCTRFIGRPSVSRHLQFQARAAADQEQVPDASYDFVARNQNLVRSLPLWAGTLGFVSLLANRTLSGIAPIVDAGSSQSRADVLGILLSAVLLLTGLQWLALKSKQIEPVRSLNIRTITALAFGLLWAVCGAAQQFLVSSVCYPAILHVHMMGAAAASQQV